MIPARKVSKCRVFSDPSTGKYGPEKNLHLDTFYAVILYAFNPLIPDVH